MELAPVPMHETWKAMEELHDDGLAKQIGVSNYNCQSVRDLLNYARIKPAVLQVTHYSKIGQSRPLFVYFRLFHITQFNKLMKARWCTWDSNPVVAWKA